MNRKGQSATEYLMTYGWAILAIAIVGALLYTQVFNNPSTRVDVKINAVANALEPFGLTEEQLNWLQNQSDLKIVSYPTDVIGDVSGIVIVSKD